MAERKILVVEDEPRICLLYSRFFSREGYTVQTAESAEEALGILEDERIKVMFLDLNLPGMNGVDLCRQIRREWPTAICHAVTGYDSQYALRNCREAGFEDYFIKPVALSDLLVAAEHAFEKLARWAKR